MSNIDKNHIAIFLKMLYNIRVYNYIMTQNKEHGRI